MVSNGKTRFWQHFLLAPALHLRLAMMPVEMMPAMVTVSATMMLHLMPVTVAVLRMAKGVRMRAFAIWIVHVIHALVRVLMSAALMIL